LLLSSLNVIFLSEPNLAGDGGGWLARRMVHLIAAAASCWIAAAAMTAARHLSLLSYCYQVQCEQNCLYGVAIVVQTALERLHRNDNELTEITIE